MSTLDRARLLTLSPDAVGQAHAAVLPFSDADGEPGGHTSARANFSFRALHKAEPPDLPHPVTVLRTITLTGARVPWRLDDGTQFDSDATDPAALAQRQATAANFQAAAVATQRFLFDQVLPRSNTMPTFRINPHGEAAGLARDAVLAVLAALRPTRPAAARITSRLTRLTTPDAIPPRFDPSFPQGMFRALSELAPDLFLVGTQSVPDDTVGLVRVNPTFIEAYLIGLNHEFGRELLWRGFPSDGRGTYFRRFWDTDSYPALSEWRSALGTNGNSGDRFVMLVRGELGRRYPRATVFAQRGALDGPGTHFVPGPDPRRYPGCFASPARLCSAPASTSRPPTY